MNESNVRDVGVRASTAAEKIDFLTVHRQKSNSSKISTGLSDFLRIVEYKMPAAFISKK